MIPSVSLPPSSLTHIPSLFFPSPSLSLTQSLPLLSLPLPLPLNSSLPTIALQDRKVTLDLVRRAEKAGYKALAVTVDTPVLGRREADIRNKFSLPAHLTMGKIRHTIVLFSS